jgi:NAD+ synthase (glutamine-hydrolysing)
MCGGLAVIADVPKTTVYALARWFNREKPLIPQSSIDKPPSAELKPDQKDQDDLPEYETLDAVLTAYIEGQRGAAEISRQGFSADLVRDVIRRIDRNEYKRRQAAPCLKISPKAFGVGRRMPIARGSF